MDHFIVRAPATTANLGPGFDIMGMALSLFNEFEVTAGGDQSLDIRIEGEGKDSLPRDESNLFYRALLRGFNKAGEEPPPMNIIQRNRIPLERGLGSSATAITGGLLAASAILGKKLIRQDVINMAVDMEGHPDNILACFLGNIVINYVCKGSFGGYMIAPSAPLEAAVAIPQLRVSTKAAREMLPDAYSLGDVTESLRNVSLLTVAFQSGKYELLTIAMNDRIHQPYRKKLIPGFDEVKEAALAAGAYGAAISGSGPAVIALCRGEGETIASAMAQAFLANGTPCAHLVTGISPLGAHIVSEASCFHIENAKQRPAGEL